MSHDNGCPDCHAAYDLQLVLKDRLVKRCRDCGHKWNEERSPTPRKSNYILATTV